MINVFNIAKNNNLLSIKNLKYLSIPFYLQNSIIGMENNNQKKTNDNINNNQNTINESKTLTETETLTENEIFKRNINILIKQNKDYLKNLNGLENLNYEDYEKKKETDIQFSAIFEYLSISEFNKVLWSKNLSTICRCNIKKGNKIIKNKSSDIMLCYKFVKNNCFNAEKIPFLIKKTIPSETKGYNNIIDIFVTISNKYLDLIITPFYELRDLNCFHPFIRKQNYIKNFKISTLFYFKQIIDGYGLLYDHNIFHRDIKPENIFINSNFYFKIADFSVSRTYEKDKTLKLVDNGTKIYMPRELLLESEIDGIDVNKVDMYSLGCTLYITLFGKNWVNFDNVNKNNNQDYVDIIDKTELIINKIDNATGQIINKTDNATEDLIRKLLAKDYKYRASYSDIINSDIYNLTKEFDEIHKDWIENYKNIKDIVEKDCFLTYLENKKDFIEKFEEKLKNCKPIEINNNNHVISGNVLNNYINNTNNISNINNNINNNIN